MNKRIYGNKIIDPVVRLGQNDLIRRNALMNGLYYDAVDIEADMLNVVKYTDKILSDDEYVHLARSVLNNIKEENGVMDSIYKASDKYIQDELYFKLIESNITFPDRFDHITVSRIRSYYINYLECEGYSKESIAMIFRLHENLPEELPKYYYECSNMLSTILDRLYDEEE